MTEVSNHGEMVPVVRADAAQADNLSDMRVPADAGKCREALDALRNPKFDDRSSGSQEVGGPPGDDSPAAKSMLADLVLVGEAIGNEARETVETVYYRDLARKEILSIDGKGPALTKQETAELTAARRAKRNFRHL